MDNEGRAPSSKPPKQLPHGLQARQVSSTSNASPALTSLPCLQSQHLIIPNPNTKIGKSAGGPNSLPFGPAATPSPTQSALAIISGVGCWNIILNFTILLNYFSTNELPLQQLTRNIVSPGYNHSFF